MATIQKLQNFALQPMEISKRYNSVPVKDNCALFAPTPYIWARAIRRCHLNFSPADPRCHGNEFWDTIDYNSAPVKDNCALFAPTPLFSGILKTVNKFIIIKTNAKNLDKIRLKTAKIRAKNSQQFTKLCKGIIIIIIDNRGLNARWCLTPFLLSLPTAVSCM